MASKSCTKGQARKRLRDILEALPKMGEDEFAGRVKSGLCEDSVVLVAYPVCIKVRCVVWNACTELTYRGDAVGRVRRWRKVASEICEEALCEIGGRASVREG